MTPVVICVPARNEAERLPVLMRSLASQEGVTGPLRVVVVANNCTDETVPVLQAWQREHSGGELILDLVDVRLAPEEAHVGFARRMAMDRGAEWLERDGVRDGVLLTTDADAIAPRDWVAANLEALRHAELVGGRLCIDDTPDGDGSLQSLHRRIERYWAAVRALEQRIDPPGCDPDPRHGDHTAASLGLSVALYRRVGGLPTLACGEDNALVTRVRCLGGRIRHCPRVSITVSARAAGRVEGGMASEMQRRATLLTKGGRYELPPASQWRELIERRASLRRGWWAFLHRGRDAAALHALGLSDRDLAAIAPAACPNDIAFVERAMLLDSQRAPSHPPVGLDEALEEFDALLNRVPEPTRRVPA